MVKRGGWTSWTTFPGGEATFLDPTTERSAGMMLATFRSDWDNGGSSAADEQFVSSGAASERASELARPGDPSARPTSGFPAVFDLATLDGTNGFRIDGIDAYDRIREQPFRIWIVSPPERYSG